VLLEAVLLKGIDVDVVMQHYLPVGGCMIDSAVLHPLCSVCLPTPTAACSQAQHKQSVVRKCRWCLVS
jgi:hypothetical protein